MIFSSERLYHHRLLAKASGFSMVMDEGHITCMVNAGRGGLMAMTIGLEDTTTIAYELYYCSAHNITMSIGSIGFLTLRTFGNCLHRKPHCLHKSAANLHFTCPS